jgi:hypothetical protein
MFTFLSRRPSRQNAAARLRRITAVLAAVASGVAAWAAAVPAASASVIPVPDGAYGPVPAGAGGTVRIITAGGMPGWQIILIAVAAALVAATTAVILDRARTSHRSAPARG